MQNTSLQPWRKLELQKVYKAGFDTVLKHTIQVITMYNVLSFVFGVVDDDDDDDVVDDDVAKKSIHSNNCIK